MTTAPGKLFVIGEYAVVYGGNAVLVPVPHLARATVIEDGLNQLTIRTKTTRRTPLLEALASEPLLSAVVETLNCANELQSLSISLDTSEFYSTRQKLGLGSSAALTAALVKALRPRLPRSEQLTLAISAHRQFQAGRGSGADVALAVEAAPISFRTGYPPLPYPLPEDLHMLAIWSGKPASTTAYLEQVEAWRTVNPDRFEYHIGRLSDCTVDFLTATDTTSRISKIQLYARYLSDFSEDSSIKFYNATHLALQKEVESARCVYKPSGAGGGDFGTAFSANKNTLIHLAERIVQEGRLAFLIR